MSYPTEPRSCSGRPIALPDRLVLQLVRVPRQRGHRVTRRQHVARHRLSSPACSRSRSIVWQAIRLANINLEIGVTPAMITAALAMLLLIFAFIRFIDKPGRSIADEVVDRTIWAWIGLVLAIVDRGRCLDEHAGRGRGPRRRARPRVVDDRRSGERRGRRHDAPPAPPAPARRPPRLLRPPPQPADARCAGDSRAATRRTSLREPAWRQVAPGRLRPAAPRGRPARLSAWPRSARCASRRASPRCSRAA